ncbi:MAG TPA: SPFH domain-containing protein, partial [Candidatus Limnocylindrales bacterium]
MSEEPTTTDAAPVNTGELGRSPTYLQITQVEAGPLEAGDAIERADENGRVPVIVRIRRQPPINPAWIVVAVGLAASGLFLPLVAALRAMIILVAVVVLIVGLTSRLFMRIPPGTVGLVARSGRHQGTMTDGVHRVNPFLALTHVVTTRELAFDVPVAAVRSSDGV